MSKVRGTSIAPPTQYAHEVCQMRYVTIPATQRAIATPQSAYLMD
jgi:hypothetical protein